MATVCAKVFKHHQKVDGTYNVKIRVYHKNLAKWIETDHFVTDKQLSKKMTIKDPFINSLINKRLDDYRLEIAKLGGRLQFFTCDDLKDYLETYNKEIDFIEHYKLCLYIAGHTRKTYKAIENLKKYCETHLKDAYTIEVIDLRENPQLAEGEQIIATPTLVKKLPAPVRILVGDLSQEDRFLVRLNLTPWPKK